MRAGKLAVAAAVLAALLALTACDTDKSAQGSRKGEANTGSKVVAPGKPGEPAKTLSAEDAAKAGRNDTPNSADFSYTQMMIVHHGQALEMTKLVAQRADAEPVKKLAERIAAAQGPEIGAMQGWLDSHGGARKQSGHDHASMPGMATTAQLAQLRAAKGKAFDELFLKLMITHHQGAITMATEVLSEGNNVLVEEMANDVLAQQTSEIGRMRAMA
ncbi:DUF305 domain-containing protein [Streptomyces beijiangensis]|uniref:DUF305 domain-containing protein n=2 Tax=Streptomyces beijiangensis TaxID=163361 RepID=A0A939F2H0_9ACTN|nr:DUF305 domain-containing protein [Streptomyces beijiangensis]